MGCPRILVIHGVHVGTNESIDSHEKIKELIDAIDPNIDCDVELFAYEDVNDLAIPAFAGITKVALDVVGDVVSAWVNSPSAQLIRKLLSSRISEIHLTGQPLIIISHSLGTVYAFDVINEMLITHPHDGTDHNNWLVDTLITMGSPLGLILFNSRADRLIEFDNANMPFPWLNYWDKNDPIVSGSLFVDGDTSKITDIYDTVCNTQGWCLLDVEVDTGKKWMDSHHGYWDSDTVGTDLVNIIKKLT